MSETDGKRRGVGLIKVINFSAAARQRVSNMADGYAHRSASVHVRHLIAFPVTPQMSPRMTNASVRRVHHRRRPLFIRVVVTVAILFRRFVLSFVSLLQNSEIHGWALRTFGNGPRNN